MSDFLATMARSSVERAATVDPHIGDGPFGRPPVPLEFDGFDLIAEIKERSPAEGELATAGEDRVERARQYVAGGAAAISVLTEPSRFAGRLEHLEAVAEAVPGTPVMRKDFLVAPIQIDEARRAGASGVLLIVAMLDDTGLRAMLDTAYEHGLFVLLEAFDEADLGRLSALLDSRIDRDMADRGRLLAGVNSRNLRTLEVDAGRLEAFAPLLPRAHCVAESGLKTPDDAAAAAAAGYRLGLVGTALMRSRDPAALIRSMREAGSRALAA